MTWLRDLFTAGSSASSVFLIALVAALGLMLGAARLRGAGLGVAGVLFVGLLFGHLGVILEPKVAEFARDYGLVLFVYAIGTAVGPGFLEPLRRRGVILNLVSVANIALGSALAALIASAAGIPMPVAVGMLAGASTNTPSLGAAQTALRDLAGGAGQLAHLPALGYAVCYPFGVIGIILAIIAIRPLFRKEMSGAGSSEGPAAGEIESGLGQPKNPADRAAPFQVVAIFAGIAAGVFVGSIPLPIRGLPAPVRLGAAGGPLIVAMLLSARERIGPLSFRVPEPVNAALRDIGIAIFLACVALAAGGTFVESIRSGGGLIWMAWGVVITLVPATFVALLGNGLLRGHYSSTCGLMAGCTTNPAALAFALASTRSHATTVAYATVYPLTMVLRVLSTQLFVLLLVR